MPISNVVTVRYGGEECLWANYVQVPPMGKLMGHKAPEWRCMGPVVVVGYEIINGWLAVEVQPLTVPDWADWGTTHLFGHDFEVIELKFDEAERGTWGKGLVYVGIGKCCDDEVCGDIEAPCDKSCV